MRVVITGGVGLLGGMLAESLIADGHEVIALSRSPEKRQGDVPPGVRVERWDARTAEGWDHLADGADAIVNLAAHSIGGTSFPPPRWTEARKQRIVESRKNAGAAVVEAVRAAKVKPRMLIQQSGVGYYGPRGDEPVDESEPPGSDFPAQVCVIWEESTEAVEALGVRRVVTRTAPVLDPVNNAVGSLVLQLKLFAGGPLGSGRQYFPWVHREDWVRAMRFFIENEQTRGAYNVVAPQGVTNREVARALGRILRRPSFLGVPALPMRIVLGEVSTIVLDGQRVVPQRLEEAGFTFNHPEFEPAMRDILGK